MAHFRYNFTWHKRLFFVKRQNCSIYCILGISTYASMLDSLTFSSTVSDINNVPFGFKLFLGLVKLKHIDVIYQRKAYSISDKSV